MDALIDRRDPRPTGRSGAMGRERGAAVGLTALAAVAAAATADAVPRTAVAGYRTALFLAAVVTALALAAVRRLPGPAPGST